MKNGETPPVKPEQTHLAFIMGTLADTTWRMFVPTIGLTTLGFTIDKTYGTKPWLMIIGIVLGAVIAGMLVKRQLFRK